MRPHRQQPTRLPRLYDSPGKNTGVGCHFLLQCMKVKNESEVTQLCPTPRDPVDCSLPGSSVLGIFQARVLKWGAIALSIQCISSWRREWQPTPIFLPGESHGQRSLAGFSPWGHKESDTTEGLRFHFSLSCIGEGNVNPHQCSCLENPRDPGTVEPDGLPSMESHRVGHG